MHQRAESCKRRAEFPLRARPKPFSSHCARIDVEAVLTGREPMNRLCSPAHYPRPVSLNDCQRYSMPTQVHFNRNFSADDRKVYDTWLRRTLFMYAVLALLGLGLISAVVLTKATTVADFEAGAIGMVTP